MYSLVKNDGGIDKSNLKHNNMKKFFWAVMLILCTICFSSCVETYVDSEITKPDEEIEDFGDFEDLGGEQTDSTTTIQEYKLTIYKKTISTVSEIVTEETSENNTPVTTETTSNDVNALIKITPYVTTAEEKTEVVQTEPVVTTATEEVRYHYPAEGQGLKEIAQIYNCDFQTLLQYNGLTEDSIIYVNQPILIPPDSYYPTEIDNDNNTVVEEPQAVSYKHEPGYYAGTTYTSDYNSLLNIEHSCQDLNGCVVPAYSNFSWFGYVGPCIDGYEEAIVIDDSYIPTPEKPNPTSRGGGICVTSSCLRNAAEAVVGSENILEAHNHTRNGEPINMSYASIGHQAALDYSHLDFRFYNPYPYSLRIEASFDWNTQTCYVSVIPQ